MEGAFVGFRGALVFRGMVRAWIEEFDIGIESIDCEDAVGLDRFWIMKNQSAWWAVWVWAGGWLFFVGCAPILSDSGDGVSSGMEVVGDQSGAAVGKLEKTAGRVALVYDPGYTIRLFGLQKCHPFDIGKYDRIAKALRRDGLMDESNWHRPELLDDASLSLVHSEAYLASLGDSGRVAHYLEAPALAWLPGGLLEKRVVRPFKLASGGTLLAAKLALQQGVAINLGGGFHHAKPDAGEGFCLIADVANAIRRLQQEGLIKRALVIDTDIHQGNGSIVCLEGDARCYTFSLHEEGIYPIPKERGDRDVGLPPGVGDAAYLELLSSCLPDVLAASKPDIVFHVSGCDSLAGDPLANGTMTAEGIKRRDAMVLDACRRAGLPYVMTLSGGYSKNAWEAQYLSVRSILMSVPAR